MFVLDIIVSISFPCPSLGNHVHILDTSTLVTFTCASWHCKTAMMTKIIFIFICSSSKSPSTCTSHTITSTRSHVTDTLIIESSHNHVHGFLPARLQYWTCSKCQSLLCLCVTDLPSPSHFYPRYFSKPLRRGIKAQHISFVAGSVQLAASGLLLWPSHQSKSSLLWEMTLSNSNPLSFQKNKNLCLRNCNWAFVVW